MENIVETAPMVSSIRLGSARGASEIPERQLLVCSGETYGVGTRFRKVVRDFTRHPLLSGFRGQGAMLLLRHIQRSGGTAMLLRPETRIPLRTSQHVVTDCTRT